jgi:putative FmdB family regulatory protein
MPIYSYECTKCGSKADFLVSLNDRDKVQFYCVYCTARMKEAIPESVGIAFKGPGFHKNDYPT